MRRMLTAAAIADLTFASLAGCTPDEPVSAPSRTVTAAPTATDLPTAVDTGCSPAGATTAWRQQATAAGTISVGVYVLDYRAAAKSRVTFVANDAQVTWDTRELEKFTLASSTLDVWKSVLLTSLSKAPSVETGFGVPVTVANPRIPPVEPGHAKGDVWLVAMQTQHVTIPFVVRCGGSHHPQELSSAELAQCPAS